MVRTTVGALLGMTLLAACGSNGLQTTSASGGASSGTTPSSQDSASSSPSSAASLSSSPSSAASPSRAPSSGPPICALSGLTVGTRIPPGSGAAGSRYVLLTFRNATSKTCVLDGHPGVSFVGKGNGTQLGDPAARRSPGTRRVELEPGHTTTALLQIVAAGNYDPQECAPTTSDGFRVYPPDSRSSAFVPFRTKACQHSLGSQHQLTVSAVGQAR